MARASGQLDRSLAALTIGVQQAMSRRANSSISEAAAETYQQVQVPLSGSAAAGVAFIDAEVHWRVPFLFAPQQRLTPFGTPHFSYGVEFTGGAPSVPVLIHASVIEWITNARNWLVGAKIRFTCESGTVSGQTTTAFSALAHLTFQGYAAQPEDTGLQPTPDATFFTDAGDTFWLDDFSGHESDSTLYYSVTGSGTTSVSGGHRTVATNDVVFAPKVWWQGGELNFWVRTQDGGTHHTTIVAGSVFTAELWVQVDGAFYVMHGTVNGTAITPVALAATGGGSPGNLQFLLWLVWDNELGELRVAVSQWVPHLDVATETSTFTWDSGDFTLAQGLDIAEGGNKPVITLPPNPPSFTYDGGLQIRSSSAVTEFWNKWRDDFIRVETGPRVNAPDPYRVAWSNSLFGSSGTDGHLTSQPMPAGTASESDSAQPEVAGVNYRSVVAAMLLDSVTPLNPNGQIQLWTTVPTVRDGGGHGFIATATLYLGSTVYTSSEHPLLGADGPSIDTDATAIGSYVLGILCWDEHTSTWTAEHVILSAVPELPCWLVLRADREEWAAELWSIQNPFSGDLAEVRATIPSPTGLDFSAAAISGNPACGYRNLETLSTEVGPQLQLGQVRYLFTPPTLIGAGLDYDIAVPPANQEHFLAASP